MDVISYPSSNGVGKVTFAKTLFRFAQFITGDTRIAPGSLADYNPDGNGFMAFIRLVASSYMLKNQSAFGDTLPPALFASLLADKQSTNTSDSEHHALFYTTIREKIWNRISFEDHLPPSLDALERRWQRSIWVMDYWEQSCSDNIILLPLCLFGWKENGTDIEIDWDSPENIDSVKKGVTFLTRGCGCKTGCETASCKCRKNKIPCGPGCTCTQYKPCNNKPEGMFLTINFAVITTF